ncbi:hemerythrin family protein [Thermosynechococcus sp.]|uniref:hemerythrin family protein n=1 Tax=Thermosynechococcus sp. TaxID=2814275 RepID=UPI00391C4397
MALTYFEWTDELKTGVAMIDAHHRELVEAVNDLAGAINRGEGRGAIQRLLAFLKYYAEWHFEKEEACAQQAQCPLAETNCQAHRQFLTLLKDFQSAYRQFPEDESLATRLHESLANWLVSHIMKIDKKIGEYLNGQSLSVP